MALLLGLILWLVSGVGAAGLTAAVASGAQETPASQSTWTSGGGGGSSVVSAQPLKRPLRQSRARQKGASTARTIEFLTAFLRDLELKESQSYLERGRAFASTPADILADKWAVAFVAASGSSDRKSLVEYADLSAEFRLRNLPLPAHLVRDAMVAVRQRIDEARPEDFEVIEAGLRRFKAEMRKPKN